MYGQSALRINPANTYPWPLVTKKGKPMVVSAEMSVLYRFHEFIISSFPITDAANNTLWEQDLFSTGFNASGFIDAGLENVLRGMVGTHIPNFKSGVDESFRSWKILFIKLNTDYKVNLIGRLVQPSQVLHHFWIAGEVRERFTDWNHDLGI